MAFDPNKITFFGRTDSRGQHVTFGIKAKDRQRHVYVIGKTGMGKSTLLENMAVQDIQNGEGMAFIDPHGSAAETLLNYIPEHRLKDVLYFAPADASHPVSFNIMEDVGPDKRHLVVSGLMSVFKKIWVDAWSARMEYILQNTLMALLEYPDSTLLGVNRMLSDKKYRDAVVANVKDPGVRAFWVDEFAKYNERYMQEAGDSIKNKIGQFTNNPIIRHIIGQPKSSFDIRQMMDEKKIIIMNLSKGLIGESNANLLGSMLTTRIYLAAMSRADLSPEKMRDMPNFYFYVDEFQSFANATFANILSEARKYHLNLTIAHQYIEQMEEEVRNAVFGNVGTVIAFRVGPFDAEVLETIFTPQFLATDIVNLGFAQVYLTLMIDGIGSQPFSATTLPPIAPPQVSCKDMVIAASRSRFARTRAEVEVLIEKFHEPIVVEKPPRKETGDAPREPKEAFREGMQTTVSAPPPPPRVTPSSTGNGQRSSATAPTRAGSSISTERHERPRDREIRSAEPRTVQRSETAARPAEAHRVEQRVSAVVDTTPREAERTEAPVVKNEQVNPPAPTPHRNTPPTVAPAPQQPHTKKEDRLNELRSVLRGVVKTDETKQSAPKVGGKDTKAATFEKSHAELKNLIAQTLKNPPQHEPVAAVRREVVSPTPVSKQNHVRRTRAIPRFVTPKITEVPPVAAATTQKINHAPTGSGDTPVQNTPHHEQHGVTPKELERMMRVTTSDKPPL